ncbi:esterase [Salegentibacter sp. LM13S]|uniref:alpha/beta hydrolase n=1 Tax=Salegentibacter lacus TaxID=2873599 RepID=UPI001CCFB29F|nr:alpha/beta hydrolase-fold protein [Salegentibacter lacus]MBZ9631915.1 esterase [Salegentibacter lacus]
MNKIYKIVFLALLGSVFFSFQIEKTNTLTDSQFYIDSIFSKSLGEYRKHTVYLPKGFNKQHNYPVIYATDGSTSLENNFYKITLDSLIDNKIIEPTIYIASHSNRKIAYSTTNALDGEKILIDYRNLEYVETFQFGTSDPDLSNRFKNHLFYFKDELIPQVEKELNQGLQKSDRFFYGFSNGAGFGVNLLNKYPDVIGTYICYSTLGSNVKGNKWHSEEKYPDLYLQYGDEESFVYKREAEDLVRNYKNSNSFVEVEIFKGGHNYKKWNEGFIRTISKLL